MKRIDTKWPFMSWLQSMFFNTCILGYLLTSRYTLKSKDNLIGVPANTKKAHNLSFCRKQTTFMLYYLFLQCSLQVKKMSLHIFWNISWVTTDIYILKKKAFSPLILLCCNLEVSLCFWCFCSALRFPIKVFIQSIREDGNFCHCKSSDSLHRDMKKAEMACAVPALQALLCLLLFCRNRSMSSNKTKPHKCAEWLWIYIISRFSLMAFHRGLDFWVWRLSYIQHQCVWHALF